MSDENFADWKKKTPFVFVHVGDLHITQLPTGVTDARAIRGARFDEDLKKIFAEINKIKARIRFVYLPGDLAENAGISEYDSFAGILNCYPKVPVRLIPGDHDFAQGTIANFKSFRMGLAGTQRHPPPVANNTLEGKFRGCPPHPTSYALEQFYYEETIAGVKCLFLDLVTAGHGYKGVGLDFRLGQKDPSVKDQIGWLTDKIDGARKNDMPCAVFMHAYPRDLADRSEIETVAGLFWNGGVSLVEMGHTHYNEIGHDGRTLYATARSVGQNEDGPVGYAIVAIDPIRVEQKDACGQPALPKRVDVTSWRFKPLQQTLPFVMIINPADRRLATAPLLVDRAGCITVRALVFWDTGQSGRCDCRVDNGPWQTMGTPGPDGVYAVTVSWPEGSRMISVRARDATWSAVDGGDLVDIDTIEPAPVSASTTTERDRFQAKTMPDSPGSDAFAIGSWPEKGLRGDQIGPNKKGHRW